MNHRALRSILTPLPALALCTLAAFACGGSNTPDGGRDLHVSADLSVLADLRIVDLAPIPDLLPPMVPLPANCQTGTYTVTNIYNDIVKPSCAISANCHAAGGVHYTITQASDITAMWVNHPADQDANINRVTPGNVNQSYVMYKITGTQGEVAQSDLAGLRMPRNGPPYLSDALICEMAAWITGGAH